MKHRGAVGVLLAIGSGIANGAPSRRDMRVVHILVRDEAGVPVPEVTVRYDRKRPSLASPVQDGDGYVPALPAPPGGSSWLRVQQLRLTNDRSPPPLAPVDVELPESAGSAVEVTVVLPPAKHIKGQVLGRDGRGLPGMRVWAQEGPQPREYDVQHSYFGSDATNADADGRFDLAGLGGFAYDLFVFPRGEEREYLPTVVLGVVGGSEGVQVTSRVSVSAKLSVLGPNGKPASQVMVGAERDHGQPTWAFGSFDDGKHEGPAVLTSLDLDGTYTLMARAIGTGTLRVAHWRPRDDTIRLPPYRSLQGTVRDTHRMPVPGVHVDWVGRPIPDCGMPGHPDFGYVVTSADGEFILDNVPQGELTVTYQLLEDWRGPTASLHASAEAWKTDQALDLGESIQVRLEGGARDPTAPVWADLFAGAEQDPERWTYWHHVEKLEKSSLGVFRCARSEVAYTLVVGDLAGNVAIRRGLRAGDVATVSLGDGLSVEGRVLAEVDLDDRARVKATPTGFAVAKDDGTFTMNGLPPGKWRVTATATSGGQHLFAAGVAAAGRGDIELVLHAVEAPK